MEKGDYSKKRSLSRPADERTPALISGEKNNPDYTSKTQSDQTSKDIIPKNERIVNTDDKKSSSRNSEYMSSDADGNMTKALEGAIGRFSVSASY